MASNRTKWVRSLEALALLAACGVLIYVSCGEEAPEPPRASRVFAATRSEDGQGAREILDGMFRDLLGQIASGRLTEEQRGEVQQRLVAELDRHQLGLAEHRASAAGLIVQQMFDQAKAQTARTEVTARQALAIQGMARELGRQLLALASGSSPGADGIEASLPAGHERLDWKRLGSFTYQEGAPLPPHVLALDGQSVGVPGFMLTLGEAVGASEFILVESLWGCCFGSVPDLNQTILVRMRDGERLDYTSAPLLVSGVLDVGEERDGTSVTSVYRIIGASVRSLDAAP